MRLKSWLFYRIKVFNLMRSHQTSRTSQISHFRIKYEVSISFITAIWEKLEKNRNNHPEMFCEKGVRNSTKFTGKHLCQSLFFFLACNFIKRETLTQLFSCEFCKISKNTFSCEDVYVIIGNPAFCLALHLTGIRSWANYSMLVTGVSKKSSAHQLELKK